MIIVPLSGKISRRNPPVITIAIILINCFVLFFLQSGDSKLYQDAMEFYFDSGLASIETDRYKEYSSVYENDASAASDAGYSQMSNDELMQRYMDMQQDREFMKRLEAGEIITPDDDIYADWREKRNQFESVLGSTVTMRYGFIPEKWSISSAFSYMFLHGGFMHLLGNMIFLWLAGCVLELAWGRLMYVGLYIAGGLFAVMLYGLVYTGSTTPLIGASGAIAGLMGAYAVLYGKRKIKVFYSLGFYFNYTMVPALIVLPLWIGNEVGQLFLGSVSNVAYVAHIGGLASGALMGFLNTKFIGRIDENVLEDDPGEKIPQLMEEALGKIEKLDMKGARPILNRVLEIDPNNRECLTHLYNMEKLDAGSPTFHEAAKKLLNNLLNDNHVHKETLGVYQEYIKSASQPRLPLSLLFRISSYFAATGHVTESEKIVGMILRKSPNVAKLPEGLLHIARACIKEDLHEKARKYLQVICLQYPASSECGIARRMLEDMSV